MTQTFGKKPFLLEAHLDRLWNSARKLDITIDVAREEIIAEIFNLIDKFNHDRAYIRIIITRGEGEISLDPKMSTQNNLIIMAKALPDNPRWWYEQGISVIIADTLRNPSSSMDPNIKSGNYLNNVLAMNEATKLNSDDAIMLNHEGNVTEATTSNVWIVKDNKIITPPISAGILEGITRQTLISAINKHKIPLSESNFNAEQLKNADECFITSSTKLIVPVTKIDGKSIGKGMPGEVSTRLLELYCKDVGISPIV